MSGRSSTRHGTLVLRGEVVEILEQQGQRFVKLSVRSPGAADVLVGMPEAVHLGDEVTIEARVVADAVKRVAQTPTREGNAAPDTGGSDE